MLGVFQCVLVLLVWSWCVLASFCCGSGASGPPVPLVWTPQGFIWTPAAVRENPPSLHPIAHQQIHHVFLGCRILGF